MVGIVVFSISFRWYYIYGSRVCITHVKRNYRTMYVVVVFKSEGIYTTKVIGFSLIPVMGVLVDITFVKSCLYINSYCLDSFPIFKSLIW